MLSPRTWRSSSFIGENTAYGHTQVDLTKNIPNILNDLQDEVGYAVGKHIGDVPGTPLPPPPKTWPRWQGVEVPLMSLRWARVERPAFVSYAEPSGCTAQ